MIAYSALFVLFGLLVRNSIVWGLAYILVWEGVVAAFGNFAAKLAVRGYTRSIITARTGVDLDLGDLSLAVSIAVPLLAAAVALAGGVVPSAADGHRLTKGARQPRMRSQASL